MKTMARLQAAIEILQSILLDNALPERAFTAWGRSHKFAGSSDRRAIADTVYDVLRHLGMLRYYVGGNHPFLLVAAWVVFVKHQSVMHLFDLFNGEKHAPRPLTKEEQKIFLSPKSAPKNFEAVYNVHKELEQTIKDAYPEQYQTILKGLEGRAPLDIRVNVTLTTREKMLIALQAAYPDMSFKQTPWSSTGIRTFGHFNLKDSELYQQGLIDIQDESSQVMCELLSHLKPLRLLDFCAGGGGKSLSFAIHRPQQTEIVASDISEERLAQMKQRALRSKLLVRQIAAHRLHPDFGLFDMVWIDAPCSGSGTWRRNIYDRMITTPETIAAYALKQQEILKQAMPFVGEQGFLVYTTCSIFPAENDAVIEAFLQENKNYKLLERDFLLSHMSDLAESVQQTPYGISLRPDNTQTDGFYCAVIQKIAS